MTKTIAIMQPYFIPYIGYFQTINAVDQYVIYDDVNYIKGGWINRNNILLNGEKKLVTLPLKGASSNKNINAVHLGSNKDKILKTMDHAYSKAPFKKITIELLESIFNYRTDNLSEFVSNSIIIISNFIGIDTEFLISSNLTKNNNLKGQRKVIDICNNLSADTYINAIGGMALYEKNSFSKQGIELKFLKTDKIKYEQFDKKFTPNLSIIDVLMFNNQKIVNSMLNMYELL